jgi:diguanylate cyclase (GGDEF)-like protein/PAS domain S-box-containing protein
VAARVIPAPNSELERLPIGIFQTDADGNCLYVNARWRQYAGMSTQEALGHGWMTAIHPDDRARVTTAWQAAVEAGGEVHLEFRSLRPDGSVAWLAGSAVSLQKPTGEVIGYVGTVDDITEAVASRQQLADERLFVDRVLDIAGSLVCVLDPEGRILRFNRACEVVTGYSFEEVQGRPFYEFLLPPEEIEAVKEALGRLREGEPPAASENNWITREGELRLISWLDTCFFDEAGSLTHIVSTGLDISDERRAEATLRGIEPIGTLLAKRGPTPDTLTAVLAAIADHMGYAHLVLFLASNQTLSLGAQVGYEHLPSTFDPATGIVGRVFRTGTAELVADVASDPDYVIGHADVRAEIVVPLLAEGVTLGVLSVASATAKPLGNTDLRLARAVADRLSVALLLGREQQSLTDRARLFGALNEFGRAANSTLEEERLLPNMLAAGAQVVPSALSVLILLDPESGNYRVRAALGDLIDQGAIGSIITPGQGVSGRAISSRAMVVDTLDRARFPLSIRDHVGAGRLTLIAVPLTREGVVLGALLVGRRPEVDAVFTDLEREILTLIGVQAALAIANAQLLAEVHALAIRDALTGLYNRRHFDAALEHIMARWTRDRANPRPVSAIMFDLDRFGQFNKDHGHQAGDSVLRAFAGILKTRFRSADLVARYGGEEFVAILEGSTREQAAAVAEDVRRLLETRAIEGPDDFVLHATVSAGCAELDPGDPRQESLLRTADVGLFMAKRNGRNQVVSA